MTHKPNTQSSPIYLDLARQHMNWKPCWPARSHLKLFRLGGFFSEGEQEQDDRDQEGGDALNKVPAKVNEMSPMPVLSSYVISQCPERKSG